MSVIINNTVITLERGKTPVVSSLPGASTVRMNGKFQIRELHLFTVLETEFGLTVTWDRGTRLYITLDPKFKGQLVRFQYMIYALLTLPLYRNVDVNNTRFKFPLGRTCGLCGNFNGDRNDDFMSPQMLPETLPNNFGDSWKIDSSCPDAVSPRNPCATNKHREPWAHKMCSVIRGDVFKPCHDVVSTWQKHF